MCSRWIKLALFLILFKYTYDFCADKTDGFTIAKIASLPSRPEWEAPGGAEEAKKILAQKFFYLGCGGQCFAFVSEDGKYVLKLLKSHFGQLPMGLCKSILPSKKFVQRSRKVERDYTSYLLAYQSLKEETGLILLHLNPTEKTFEPVSIADKLNIEHKIDLNPRGFLLQKKGDLLYARLEKMKKAGDFEGAKKTLHALFAAVVERSKKGIYDEDPRLHKNLGFIGDQALFIDAGRFRLDPSRASPEVYHRDLSEMTRRFRGWLNLNYPELVPELEKEVYSTCAANYSS